MKSIEEIKKMLSLLNRNNITKKTSFNNSFHLVHELDFSILEALNCSSDGTLVQSNVPDEDLIHVFI